MKFGATTWFGARTSAIENQTIPSDWTTFSITSHNMHYFEKSLYEQLYKAKQCRVFNGGSTVMFLRVFKLKMTMKIAMKIHKHIRANITA